MVWSFPPNKDIANTNKKYFYNGAPVVVPEDFMHQDEINKYWNENPPHILKMPFKRILRNTGITLNNVMKDSMNSKSDAFHKDDRIMYLGVFVLILGIILTLIASFLINLKQYQTQIEKKIIKKMLRKNNIKD